MTVVRHESIDMDWPVLREEVVEELSPKSLVWRRVTVPAAGIERVRLL